jgi:nitrite reductase/ring-hydroxylating ferredoxin subunit
MSGEWLPVAARADVPEGDVIAVKVGDQDIALYGVEGEVYATANICTTAMPGFARDSSKAMKSSARFIRAGLT